MAPLNPTPTPRHTAASGHGFLYLNAREKFRIFSLSNPLFRSLYPLVAQLNWLRLWTYKLTIDECLLSVAKRSSDQNTQMTALSPIETLVKTEASAAMGGLRHFSAGAK